ncbi:family 43 glycosylhydrolase [Bacillus sonorensis]|nr:family 43 glycosylhydrolase [Bacillus sonorensis]
MKEGWQTVLRSRTIYSPYEDRIVLHQGNSAINGPHQGGLVELDTGESWFLHFQDRAAFGRVVHLQPVRWEDGWPKMGEDSNKDGIGEYGFRMAETEDEKRRRDRARQSNER